MQIRLVFWYQAHKSNFPHALGVCLFVLFVFRFPNDNPPLPSDRTHTFSMGSGNGWIPCCVYPKCIISTVQVICTTRLLKNTHEDTPGFPAFIKHATQRLFSSVCLFKNAPQATPVASSHLKIRSGHISSLQPSGFNLFICMSIYINITGSFKTTERESVTQAGNKEEKQVAFWRKSGGKRRTRKGWWWLAEKKWL